MLIRALIVARRLRSALLAGVVCVFICSPIMARAQVPDRHTTHPLPHAEGGVVILIDSDDPRVMGHAISYALNIARSYAIKHKTIKIEIVANGTGITLFRSDTSPLQEPLKALRQTFPDIVFSMCDSSKKIAEQREGHSIDPIEGVRLVPFGIGRVIELEQSGWSYING